MRASLRFAPALVVVLALAACGDDSSGTGGSGSGGDATGSTTTGGPGATTTTGGTGGGDTSSTTTGGGGDAPECNFPDAVETTPNIVVFDVFEGSAVTVDGSPVANEQIQVCGINLCLFGDTDADGNVTVTQGSDPLDVPLFKIGDGLVRAKIGFPLPDVGGTVEVVGTTLELGDSGTAIASGAVADADGIVLTVAADGLVGLNELDYSDPGEDTFRAALVPADSLDAVAPGQDFLAIVGLGPHETIFCPPAALEIPNDAGLEPGAAVELVQQGLETGQYFTLYGEWERVALGHVSEDGATIATDDGEGIPILSTIGIRLAE